MCDNSRYEKFREIHLLEKHRAESFKDWPFNDESNCSISKMAAAGFYWSGNKRENDTATCFVCAKTLDGWEASDDPWKEHAKHAPQCLFVQYGRNQEDLTGEEFLNIFSMVLKNMIQVTVQNKKKELSKFANIELFEFINKQ